MLRSQLAWIVTTLGIMACDSEQPKPTTTNGGKVEHVASAPAENCGDVRLTSYSASKGGWCEFDRTYCSGKRDGRRSTPRAPIWSARLAGSRSDRS